MALRAVPYDPVAWASAAAVGVGLPAALIAVLTEVQRRTPGPLLGRVTATTLVYTPNVIGLTAGAATVELLGHRVPLSVLGAVLGVTAAVLLAQRPASADRTASRSASDASPA